MFEEVSCSLALFSFLGASDPSFIHHFTHAPAWAAPVSSMLVHSSSLTLLPFT